MSATAEFQRALAAALLHPQDALYRKLGAGLTVYRNTVMQALIDALRANFPSVERLVGEVWFADAARAYAGAYPPSEPMLALYGESFPTFLSRLPSLHTLPYLPQVARVDRLWLESYFAADAAPLSATALQALTVQQLQQMRLVLHPATRYAWLPHSALSIWQQQRAALTTSSPVSLPIPLHIDGAAQGVLLTRPEHVVCVTPLDTSGFLFMQRLNAGEPLGEAALQVLQQHPGTDLAALLATLIVAGAFQPDG